MRIFAKVVTVHLELSRTHREGELRRMEEQTAQSDMLG